LTGRLQKKAEKPKEEIGKLILELLLTSFGSDYYKNFPSRRDRSEKLQEKYIKNTVLYFVYFRNLA
jgi:hypothetical protein